MKIQNLVSGKSRDKSVLKELLIVTKVLNFILTKGFINTGLANPTCRRDKQCFLKCSRRGPTFLLSKLSQLAFLALVFTI